jgi:hypothetical protein
MLLKSEVNSSLGTKQSSGLASSIFVLASRASVIKVLLPACMFLLKQKHACMRAQRSFVVFLLKQKQA